MGLIGSGDRVESASCGMSFLSVKDVVEVFREVSFLPPEGGGWGSWNLGEHMNFGNQKGGTEEVLVP